MADPTNCVIAIAKLADRDYVTPEDVGGAINQGNDLTKVRLDVLEILSENCGWGAEDSGLCAFIAFRGEKNER